MAVVTEMEQVSAALPPVNDAEPPRKPRGRPRKELKPEPEEPEVQITGDADFWMMLANLSTDEWQQHIAYLYRTGPMIDRKSNGRPANLCKYSTAFDREDIMKEHGSGAYRIDLCRIDPTSGKSFRIAQERFTIINPKYPPNVPPGDWVEDKANEIWKWAMPANGQPATAGYPPGFDMDKVYSRAFEMAKTLVPPPPPAKDDTVLTTLVSKLLDASLKEKPAADTTVMDRMFKMQDDMLKDMRTEIRELRNKETAPAKTLVEQIIELKPVVGEFATMFAEKSGKHQWWEGPLEKIADAIPDVISLVKAGQQQPQQPRQLNAPGLAAAPGSNQPPPQQPPATTAAVGGTPEEQQMQALLQKWQDHINSFIPSMLRHFKVNKEQRGGIWFRDWYFDGFSQEMWLELRREVGPGGLALIIEGHAPLKAQLSPPEQLQIFLKDFFCNPGEEFEEETAEPAQVHEMTPKGAA